MSWSGSYAQNFVDPQHLQEAEQQVDIFMGIVMSACQEKCIPSNYHEPDLNKGEQKCIDRCVAKYMSIQFMLGEKMKSMAPTTNTTL
ncbi:Tim10/DDP family zinc finger-domain-containing protein [Gilbertella persicaria]|uniref:Tim10/DDP family zinc finger-domain-containing protein n=1 Tax=Gilbertella persicaria TaxID=101096 RepID=UPI00221E9895|nr:Tim10/DDP family zinc finger-domain-containing protein [Gilbertella persicaria]KAI8078106.1 Tim10/DDP family zinc finger-domain-containing protein [Gilbertella persicaria]